MLWTWTDRRTLRDIVVKWTPVMAVYGDQSTATGTPGMATMWELREGRPSKKEQLFYLKHEYGINQNLESAGTRPAGQPNREIIDLTVEKASNSYVNTNEWTRATASTLSER